MNRHRFLSRVALGTLGLPLCASVLRTAIGLASETGSPHWGYSGEDGPAHWGDLAPEFSACSRGAQQSPVDISDAAVFRAEAGALAFDYHATPLRIINNGHTIQINYQPGSTLALRGQTYQIVQFHFHVPSEHARDGKLSDMELHIVHQSAAKELAVVGVLLEHGSENAALEPIWKAIPTEAGPEKTIAGATVNAASLLPSSRSYFEYMGSLTTPPCTEGVRWLVLTTPAQLSQDQIASFKKVIPMNARPPQLLNRRFVLEQL